MYEMYEMEVEERDIRSNKEFKLEIKNYEAGNYRQMDETMGKIGNAGTINMENTRCCCCAWTMKKFGCWETA